MESSADALVALPAAPASGPGSTTRTGHNWRIVVSNKAGYLCHILVQATWKDATPEVPFAVLTHPENSRLLRDMKRVGTRKVVKAEPGLKELQVHNYTKVRELWALRMYGTWLKVVEDCRDPDCMFTTFELIKSEYFIKFHGRWELRPFRDPATGRVVGCRGELHQDVLPKGVPRFLTRLPLVGPALRNVSMKAVTRLVEDLNAAIGKVLAGQATGRSTEEVLTELCAAAQVEGSPPEPEPCPAFNNDLAHQYSSAAASSVTSSSSSELDVAATACVHPPA